MKGYCACGRHTGKKILRQTREEQQQTSASSSNPHSSPQRPANLDKRIVKKRRKASGVGGGSLGSLGWVKRGLHYSTLFGDSQTSSRSRSGAAGVSQVSLMSLFITCCMLLNTCGIADARFEETIFYSPCSFNPLCICSNGGLYFHQDCRKPALQIIMCEKFVQKQCSQSVDTICFTWN